MKQVMSLGAGVQSSTMALMAARGEITPMPDLAIFADTQCEPSHVYEQVKYIKQNVPFPVITATYNNLAENMFTDDFSQIPAFFDLTKRRLSKGKRQCTTKWKIKVVHRAARKFFDVVGKPLPKHFMNQWLGISTDETVRMKDSRVRWIDNYYPLIEMGMSRNDCLEWLKSHNYPEFKRSACTFCPLQSHAEWKQKRELGGVEWQQIKDIEAQLQERGEYLDPFGLGLDNYIDGIWPNQSNLFGNECEGMCGV